MDLGWGFRAPFWEASGHKELISYKKVEDIKVQVLQCAGLGLQALSG